MKRDVDITLSYNKASEKNQAKALDFMCERNESGLKGLSLYNETIKILKGSNNELKPFAILSLEEIKNEDYKFFIKHLTNCDGCLREIVAMKLLEFPPAPEYYPLLIDALCDVNPNVARNIVTLIVELKLDLYEALIRSIECLLAEIEAQSKPKKWRTQKNHVLNKKFFNLYWYLEAISECLKKNGEDENLTKILCVCADFPDYTIREKVAKILVKMENPPTDLLQKLKNDDNYYVKLCFCDKIAK